MSPLYRLAVSDPFDRDIRAQTRRPARQPARLRAPVRRLADLSPAEQAQWLHEALGE